MEIKTEHKKRKMLPGLKSKKLKHNQTGAFPTWNEIEQAQKERVSRYGFDPAIGGGTLTLEQLKEYVSEAEQGPFFTLELGQQMIQQWREQKQNR